MSKRNHKTRPHVRFLWLLFVGLGSSWFTANAVRTNHTQHTIVVRMESPDRQISPQDLKISADGRSARIASVIGGYEAHISISLVIDAGPDQPKVLGREKDLAASLIAGFSDATTDFIVTRAGYRPTHVAATSESSVAINSVLALNAETGKKSDIPIYDAMALGIQELSGRPGIRVLVVIAEGNDHGSSVNYKQLRASAETHHVSCLTAIVADHGIRGPKSILRYGRDLEELAGDTAGIFIENDRKVDRMASRVERMIKSLRVVTFDIDGLTSGRHEISVVSHSAGRLHAQHAIVLSHINDQ